MTPSLQPSPLPANPILDEIDQAHARLSPPAKEALDQAHGMLGIQPPSTSAAVKDGIQPPPSMSTLPALPDAPQVSTSAGIPGMANNGMASMRGLRQDAGTAAAPPTVHQQELERLTAPPQSGYLAHTRSDTGQSGIDQIHNPWARVPLKILDALGGGLVPGIEQRLPGTEGHHDVLVNEAQRNVAGDTAQADAASKRELEEAQAEEQRSLPELKAAQGELAAEKQHEVEGYHAGTLAQKTKAEEDADARKGTNAEVTLRQHGFKTDESGKIVPVDYGEMSPEQRAVHDLKGSQEELADAQTAFKKAQTANLPAQMELAKKRIENASHTSAIALERLGLSEKQFEMHAHGTEGGVALPGSLQTDDGRTVGTAFQQNVRPTATQRDAAGRADTMIDLDKRIRAALKNPEIVNGTGPLAGRLAEAEGRLGTLPHDLSELRNDLKSYGAFQAGLHPVRGIGGLEYFDKVMGGLGQTPDELLGKLDSNMATAKSVKGVGSPKTAGSKEDTKANSPVDPLVKAYADKHFGGDIKAAQEAIAKQK